PGSDPGASKNPLCQNPTSGQFSNVQLRAKAYPGLRQLQVLKGLGDQAIVGSICPANTTNMAAADFGYRPAISAIVSHFRSVLSNQRCLPRALPPAANGQADCRLLEVFNPAPGSTCHCLDKPGRRAFNAADLPPEITARGTCFCEIVQLDENDSASCRTASMPSGTVASGWCYVDPALHGLMSECLLVAKCFGGSERL